jgi:L-ascorbate metabolism protein UlaG (beta-lactamase superfamily)
MVDKLTLGKKLKPTTVCNYEIHMYLQRKGVPNTLPMNKGGTQEVAGLKFTMVHATHSSGIEDGGQVIYGGEACGFVVTLEDGTRIYHAGDTAVHSDMALIAEIYAPEIALLPIGDRYTMSPREAAVATRLLKPKYVVPAHYGTSPTLTGTPEAFREELDKLGVKTDELLAVATFRVSDRLRQHTFGGDHGDSEHSAGADLSNSNYGFQRIHRYQPGHRAIR